MMKYLAPLCIALLASCGVDGDPVAPTTRDATTSKPVAKTGLSLSGRAEIGVAWR